MRDYGDWCRGREDYYNDDDATGLALVIAAVLAIILVLYLICD